MGIGNRHPRRRQCGRPCGDRKRDGTGLVPSNFGGSHYPSWGSETQGPWSDAAHDPSWSLPSPSTVRAHYPSWGSETDAMSYGRSGVSDGHGVDRDLITPHGDRKRHLPTFGVVAGSLHRQPGRTPYCSGPSHYPSWGSETPLSERPEPQDQGYQTPVHSTLKHQQAAHVTAISAVTRDSCA